MSLLGEADLLGVLLFLLALVLLLAYLPRSRRRGAIPVRSLSAFDQIPDALGRAAESGSSLHLGLGRGGIGGEGTATSLAGLQVLEGIADAAVGYGAAPIATVGDPTLMVVAQDVLRRACERAGLPERYEPTSVRFAGSDPVVYGLGAAEFVRHEPVMASAVAGAFDEEAALITSAAEGRGLAQTAAADRVRALGALFPTDAALAVGEELYAGGARLTGAARYVAGLRVQDALRFVVVVLLLLKVLGLY